MITHDDIHGGWSMSPLPGNGEVLVSHGAYVAPEARGKGLGQKLHKARLDVAKSAGASYILATVEMDNAPEIHILEKNGWKRLDWFKSTCTGHIVYLYGREIS